MSAVDVRRAELVALKLRKVHEKLEGEYASTFKAEGLSAPQYNALRILRGALSEDLSCHEVGNRMLKRVPDVTRLLDRLEQRGLVERWRCAEDRRVVRVRITKAGMDLVAAIEKPLRKVIRTQFKHYDHKKLTRLDGLLDDLLAD